MVHRNMEKNLQLQVVYTVGNVQLELSHWLYQYCELLGYQDEECNEECTLYL